MSIEEMYPSCPNIANFMEELGNADKWMYYRLNNYSPQEVVDHLTKVVRDVNEMAEQQGIPSPIPEEAELQTPDFLKYVIAKLGAM
jgi:hypothetical protein